MRKPQFSATHEDLPSALVRAELDRILASEIFARSDRLSSFLRFIVEHTLNGQGETLKEQVIANELYGKGADFNTAADPIVRVDARRLRDRLREYYASATLGALVITVPKGSYTPVFTVCGDSTARAEPGARRIVWPASAVLCLVIAAGWITSERWTRTASEPPVRLLTVTSQPGSEEDPSLSPDGHFVAYAWHQGTTANADLWVKAVDGAAALQLTDTPEVNEKWPQWSPDGQYIAYTRLVKGQPSSVFKVSRLGGSPSLIAEPATQASWARNGKSMVMASLDRQGHAELIEHVLATGARRMLVRAPVGFQDLHPRISPDGRTLAFMRLGSGRSGVFVMPMSGGDATRLGDWSNGPLGGLSWTTDGRELLFSRPGLSGRRLIRQPAGSAGPAVDVPGVPRESIGPSISLVPGERGYRLAFASGLPDIALRLVDLQAPLEGGTITGVTTFCDATRFEAPGRFSPDGTLVAFTSDRLGNQQVWIVGRDGSSPRSLTNLADGAVNVAGWSPDGRWVAFDAAIGDLSVIYRVSVDGVLQQLTDDSAVNTDPDWSRDGAWIYYASTASGRSEIWRMPAGGGRGVQLTFEGGFEPRAGADGRSVYFVDRSRTLPLLPATLKRVSTEGGPSSVVYDGIPPGAWDVTDHGVVFVMRDASQNATSGDREVLAVLDTATKRVRALGGLPFRVSPFGVRRLLIASRDGRWAIASHIDRWERDILVLENFR